MTESPHSRSRCRQGVGLALLFSCYLEPTHSVVDCVYPSRSLVPVLFRRCQHTKHRGGEDLTGSVLSPIEHQCGAPDGIVCSVYRSLNRAKKISREEYTLISKIYSATNGLNYEETKTNQTHLKNTRLFVISDTGYI